ncbi:hypothetical protein HK098_006931 [Nowakowskiella sp. JEL0407]|nr:hypothetical protein HK098_006931 [Nowakowskiella sp. JEL0407]
MDFILQSFDYAAEKNVIKSDKDNDKLHYVKQLPTPQKNSTANSKNSTSNSTSTPTKSNVPKSRMFTQSDLLPDDAEPIVPSQSSDYNLDSEIEILNDNTPAPGKRLGNSRRGSGLSTRTTQSSNPVKTGSSGVNQPYKSPFISKKPPTTPTPSRTSRSVEKGTGMWNTEKSENPNKRTKPHVVVANYDDDDELPKSLSNSKKKAKVVKNKSSESKDVIVLDDGVEEVRALSTFSRSNRKGTLRSGSSLNVVDDEDEQFEDFFMTSQEEKNEILNVSAPISPKTPIGNRQKGPQEPIVISDSPVLKKPNQKTDQIKKSKNKERSNPPTPVKGRKSVLPLKGDCIGSDSEDFESSMSDEDFQAPIPKAPRNKKIKTTKSEAPTVTLEVDQSPMSSQDERYCAHCRKLLDKDKFPESTFKALEEIELLKSKGKADSHQIWEFCRIHHQSYDTIIPSEKGYLPNIDFSKVRRRICDVNGNIRRSLEGIINDTVKSWFRLYLLKLMKKGRNKVLGHQFRMNYSQLVQCGYYGNRGAKVILHTLVRLFTKPRRGPKKRENKVIILHEDDDNNDLDIFATSDDPHTDSKTKRKFLDDGSEVLPPILTAEKAKPHNIHEFIQDILVPETAIRLIAEDTRNNPRNMNFNVDDDVLSDGEIEQSQSNSSSGRTVSLNDPIFTNEELKIARKMLVPSSEFGKVVYWEHYEEDDNEDVEGLDYGDGWFGYDKETFRKVCVGE